MRRGSADLLQHERDEGRYVAAVPARLRNRARALAQLACDAVVERVGDKSRNCDESRGVQQQPAVTETVPPGQAGFTCSTGFRLHGHRAPLARWSKPLSAFDA